MEYIPEFILKQDHYRFLDLHFTFILHPWAKPYSSSSEVNGKIIKPLAIAPTRYLVPSEQATLASMTKPMLPVNVLHHNIAPPGC